jgi:hypothetical protein
MLGSHRRGGRGVPILWALAAVAAAAMGIASCSLILDFSSERDGGADDAATPGDGGGDLCAAFEPNDDLAQAHAITPGVYQAAICPAGDDDYYRFDLGVAEDLLVRIDFDYDDGAGDLDMILYAASDSLPREQSTGVGDFEEIVRTEAVGGHLPAGAYIVRVYSPIATVENEYTLTLEITPTIADAGVPDAGIDAAGGM